MHIDGCTYTFHELAHRILPAHLERLRSAIKSPWPASAFALTKTGPKSLAARFGLDGDFGGCYTLLEDSQPVYVGISRVVLARVRQHMLGQTHFDASLAYLVAQRRRPTKGHRSANMENPEFRKAFEEAQQYLRSLNVAAVRIENALELHVFEAYAAMAFGTSTWNSFRTH
jgi:hypothetical protein